jgi:NAD(P)H-dependent flavin oxidoreductase YrpB (nitropropane dioxygenase family)
LAWGTAFLAAHEADVHPEYVEKLINAEATDTALTTAFDGGWPDAAARERCPARRRRRRHNSQRKPVASAVDGDQQVLALNPRGSVSFLHRFLQRVS